jgi:hypothetical protein
MFFDLVSKFPSSSSFNHIFFQFPAGNGGGYGQWPTRPRDSGREVTWLLRTPQTARAKTDLKNHVIRQVPAGIRFLHIAFNLCMKRMYYWRCAGCHAANIRTAEDVVCCLLAWKQVENLSTFSPVCRRTKNETSWTIHVLLIVEWRLSRHFSRLKKDVSITCVLLRQHAVWTLHTAIYITGHCLPTSLSLWLIVTPLVQERI